jgi:protease PrsW
MSAGQHWARLRAMLSAGFIALLMALAGLLVIAAVTEATGVVGFLIGLSLALLPLPVVLGALRWLDRYEPEPPQLVLFMVAWGATVAALLALVVNSASSMAIARVSGDADGVAATAVLVAPWVEEGGKGLALLLVLWFRRAEIDGLVDGLVLAGLVGLGFAFTENILYFGRAFLDGGELGVTGSVFAVGITFFLRGVLSPFAHPLFTAMTGIGVALAAGSARRSVRWSAPVGGYLAAVGLHALWNWASLSGLTGFVSGYVAIMVPVFAVTVWTAAWSRRREGVVLQRFLPPYVAAGWLSPADLPMLASTSRRRHAEVWARRTHGPAAAHAVRAFVLAATELAFLRHRLDRGQVVADFSSRERELLAQVVAARRLVTGALPQR